MLDWTAEVPTPPQPSLCLYNITRAPTAASLCLMSNPYNTPSPSHPEALILFMLKQQSIQHYSLTGACWAALNRLSAGHEHKTIKLIPVKPKQMS